MCQNRAYNVTFNAPCLRYYCRKGQSAGAWQAILYTWVHIGHQGLFSSSYLASTGSEIPLSKAQFPTNSYYLYSWKAVSKAGVK